MSDFPTNIDEFKVAFPGAYSLEAARGSILRVWFGEGVMLGCTIENGRYTVSAFAGAGWASSAVYTDPDWVAAVTKALDAVHDALQARVEVAQEELAQFKAAAARPAR